MKILKRIMAIIGIIIIAGLYIATLVLALSGREEMKQLFIASVVATVTVPCLMYIISWISKVLDVSGSDESE